MTKQGGRLAGLLAAVTLVGAVTACGGSASTRSAPSVSCANYAIHGTGKYHDEVWIQVSVSNTTSAAGNYVVGVDLTGPDPGGVTSDTHVTITGLVPAGASAVLSRKVLSTSKVQHCQITRLTRS